MLESAPLSLQVLHYNRLIRPHIREDIDPLLIGPIYGEAWKGWALGATTHDMPKALFMEWLCEQMAATHPEDFRTLLSSIVQRSYDTHVILSTAIEIAQHHRINGELAERVSTLLKHQKTAFEAFKHWGSVPYFFAVKVMHAQTKAKTPEAMSLVSAGEKYRTIGNLRLSALPQGDLKDLLGALDNRIRNAGDGHDSWSLEEDGTLILRDIHPHTGEVKEEIRFTEDELRQYVKACARTLWILEMGVSLFRINTPQFWDKVIAGRLLKRDEIRDQLSSFLHERWMAVTDFQLDRQQKHCDLVIQHIVVRHKSESGRIYFSNGQQFEVLQKEFKTPYKMPMLDALKRLVSFFPAAEIPHVRLNVLDKEGVGLAEMTFEPSELQKLHGPATAENIPLPTTGEWPEGYIYKILDIPVPPQVADQMRLLLKGMPDEDGPELMEAMRRAAETA